MAKSSSAQKELIRSLQDASNVAIATCIDDTHLSLEFQQGSFQEKEAWFIKMQQTSQSASSSEFVVLPETALNILLDSLKSQHEEKLVLMLQKDILNLMPLDLEDALAVGLEELEKLRAKDETLRNIDTELIAKRIKTNYPNLFFDVSKIL
ncbi:DUF2603 domain-containing protein [Helicobacter sp. 11S02629-2]|uniref:DUF2603 domain-containing protein n=1 Tax=Helicobacter sp. 11S02629-2 TaxID=1476195 RepID=UPI000BA57960|nr:DUF2603 domain-containing protein [Helicobacter sp. 11S02629-2]PAF45851.1 hypothetical protein BKH40_00085 [Helicobacter sp. 11S02629-2]